MSITTLRKNGITPLPCIIDNHDPTPNDNGLTFVSTHDKPIPYFFLFPPLFPFPFPFGSLLPPWMLDLASAWFRHVVEWQRSKTSRVYPYDAETHLMSKGHTLLYVIMRAVSEGSATAGFIVDGVVVHESKQVTSYISTHQLGWGGSKQTTT